MKEKIYEIVKKNVINLGIEKDILIFKEAVDSTPLYGKDGKLDSLSLIRLSIEIEENITKNLEEKLKKGFIDAAIVALPFDIPGIEIENLYEEPFVTVVPVKHPWAQKKTIKADLLASEKVLLLDNTHCYSNQVQEACPGLLKTGEIQGGNSLETIRSMVASNLGISVLPKSATTLRHVNPLVKVIQFDKPIPFRKVVLAYRKSSVKKQALEEVVKSIKKINTSTFN